jgi:hypothetical protein
MMHARNIQLLSWTVVAVLVPACIGGDDPRLSFAERVVPRSELGAHCAVAGSVPDGHPCACASDCVPGAMCQTEEESGYPGGFCFRVCDAAADDCTPDAVCLDVGAGPSRGICHPACTVSEDCPPANSCHHDVCWSLCQAHDECLSGYCEPYLTLCTDGTPVVGAGLNEACLRDADCKSGFCPASFQLCITNCSVARQGCPEGAVCEPFGEGTDMGTCFHPCTTGADCKDASFSCIASTAWPEQGLCVPSSLL